MPKILSTKLPPQNILVRLWRQFRHLDRLLQLMLVVLVMLLATTPFILNSQFEVRQKAATGAPPKGTMFDMRQWSWDGNTWNNGNDSGMQSDFDDARNAVVTWIRFNPTTLANGCDPKGCYPSFTLMDQVVAMANTRGINLEILMPYVTDTNIIQSWVNRYKGSIHYWEYGNEPNVENPQVDPVTYATQLKTVRDAVKAADPKAVMMSAGLSEWQLIGDEGGPGLANSYLYKFLDQGVCNWIDVIPVHPYSGNGSGSYNRYWQLADAIHGHTGCGNIPVWMNEVGYNTSGWNPNPVSSEQAKADAILTLWNQYRNSGVPGPYFLYTQHELTNYQSGFGMEMKDPAQKNPTVYEPLYYSYQSLWVGEPLAPVIPGPGGNTNPTPIPTITPTPIASAGGIHIDAGSSSGYTDPTGVTWQADADYTNSSNAGTDSYSNTITNTSNPQLYQSEHWGMANYHIPVSNGTYTVRLHFAENYFTSSGQRVFNYSIGGTQVNNFDVLATAGGQHVAVVKTYTVSVSTGAVDIAFTPIVDQPEINGIEVIPTTSPTSVPTANPTLKPTSTATPTPTRVPTPTPTLAPSTGNTWRIDTGSTTSYTDPSGNVWRSDTSYTNTANASMDNYGTIAIANTATPQLYQTEHWGMSSYHLPVSNGTYQVTLHFAENYFTSSGQRVFTVTVNGSTTPNLDVFAQAGGAHRALQKTYTVSVTAGAIDIGFTPIIDSPEINAIEVIPTNAVTPTPPSLSSGLLGSYFANTSLSGTPLQRSDNTINFNWGTSSPMSGLSANNFSIRWTGYVTPKTTETYTFYTYTDDGARLYVNNNLLINNWTDHSASTAKASMVLVAGQHYPITFEYYEHLGSAVAKLYWSSQTITKQIIPATALSH